MRKKITIILLGLVSAFVIISSGYGEWQKELIIEGNIKVRPNSRGIQQLVEDEVNLQKENLLKTSSILEREKLAGDQSENSFEDIDKTIEDNNAPKDINVQEGIREEKEDDEGNTSDSLEDNTNNQENNTKEPELILNTDVDDTATQPETDSSDN